MVIDQPETKSYELFEIDFDTREINVTGFSASGAQSELFGLLTEDGDNLTAFRFNNNGQPAQIRVNRVTGFARYDVQISEEQKPNLWDEKRQRMGFPPGEDVWMGYSLQCGLVNQMF